MSFSLAIHPLAIGDAETIAEYIGERSIKGVLNWIEAYESAQARILNNPLLCSPAQEEPAIKRNLRQALFKTPSGDHYRAVFIIEGTRITILRVRGKGQELLEDQEIP